MANSLQRHKKLVLHLAFWTVYASLFFYTISFGRRSDPDWGRIWADLSFHVGGLLLISYLNYFYFIPRLLKDQRVDRYLFTFIPVFAVLAALFLWGKQNILQYFYPDDDWMFSARFAINVVMSAFFAVACVGLLKFVEDYFELEARRKELENQQLTSELQFLKAQINPHFLFNTLNNLYYLAVNQSERTPGVISELSGMMRYMLYDSNHPRVPLEKEIAYIESYLSLERLRLEDEVPITFEVKGAIASREIAPLILITFLENAFKHGVSSSVREAFVTVCLEVIGNDCRYRVTNAVLPVESKTHNEKSGIGLQNVRRRLALSYPDRHTLTITNAGGRHTVDLLLKLA